MDNETKFKPVFWCEQFGIQIMDPDGWRGLNDPSWETPLTKEDFERRMGISTIQVVNSERYDKMKNS